MVIPPVNIAGNGRFSTQLIVPFLALIAAGLAGNYFNYPIFLNIDFLFGSIFALLALQFFGPGRGILAAALISGYTYVLWYHPYAIVIMTAEVAVVGWLMNRHRISLVLADTLYWLTIGIPLVYICYHIIMQSPLPNTAIVMAKQATNGIANALVARLIFTAYIFRSQSRQIHLSEIVTNLLLIFTLIPTLTLLIISSRADFSEMDQIIRSDLAHDSRQISHILNNWVENRKHVVEALATRAVTQTVSETQASLDQVRQSDPNFIRISLSDANSVSTAFSPIRDENGVNNIGKSFADRPFIPTLKQTLKPMLSEVVMGKVGTPAPRVLMLAPVSVSGEYRGMVAGTLSLENILKTLEYYSEGRLLLITLLDKNGMVITSNRSGQKIMTQFSRAGGTLLKLGDNTAQWVPHVPANTSIMERWKKSYYVQESNIGSFAEWKLILELPVAPFQKALYDRYSQRLLILFVIILISQAVSALLSHAINLRFKRFIAITVDLPKKLALNDDVPWFKANVCEVDTVIEAFREMANVIRQNIYQLNQAKDTLELRVAERTEELRASEMRWKFALEGAGEGVWDWDGTTGEAFYSHQWKVLLGYSEDEIGRGLNEWQDRIHRDDVELCRADFDKYVHGETALYFSEHRLMCKDGNYRWFQSRGKVIEWRDKQQPQRIVGTIIDISEQKRFEEALLQAKEASDTANIIKNRLLSIIAHEFHTPLGLLTISVDILERYRERLSAGEITRQYRQIMSATRQLALLVESVITFNDTNHDTHDFKNIMMNAGPLCRTIADEVNTVWSGGQRFFCDISPELDGFKINETLMRRVLVNLLTNAFRFTPATGTISLRVTVTSDGLVLDVSDSGIGIPDGDLKNIFDAFYRSQNVDARQGLGIGLSIALEAVKKMQGTVTVTSEVNSGSSFVVKIPESSLFAREENNELNSGD